MFGKKKGIAGLDVGSSSIKVVELDGKMNNLSLVSLGFENLPDDTIIDGQIMELNTVSEVIQRACDNYQIKSNQVVTGVSGHSVIIKNIVLPPMSREELEESETTRPELDGSGHVPGRHVHEHRHAVDATEQLGGLGVQRGKGHGAHVESRVCIGHDASVDPHVA